MNLTYGVFKGDFLPYEERFPDFEDFWTGYYSTRLHMKRLIRHVFNDIQSTKTLLAIRATHYNRNQINFNDVDSFKIDSIQEKITNAERKWAIMMHHDAITGTHTVHTAPSYYQILKEALHYLNSAREMLDEKLIRVIPKSTVAHLNEIVGNLSNPEIFHHTIVNPSGYYRIQILNVTVPITNSNEKDNYVVYVQDKDTVIPITKAYFADIYELNKASNKPQKIRKVFFIMPLDALSDKQVYIISTSRASDCEKSTMTCAKKKEEKKISGPIQMGNRVIRVDINKNGDLESFEFMQSQSKENFTERLTYHVTNQKTRSGLYLFNPRNTKIDVKFSRTEIYEFSMTNLLSIVQVYKYNGKERMLKTYIVNQNGCPNLMKQLFMELQIDSSRVAEISLSLKKGYKSSDATHKAYADDSMKLVERPIFDINSKIPHTTLSELEGYYTSPCVHGGMIRESYKEMSNSHQKESFFGWANSNPLGCTFSDKNEVAFMVFRSIGQSDYKGVNDRYNDEHVISTSFQFYIDSSVHGALFHKVRANTKINEPYGIFTKIITKNAFDRIPVSSNMFSDFLNFNNGQIQLSSEFGEVTTFCFIL